MVFRLKNSTVATELSLNNIKIRVFKIDFRPRYVFINSKNMTLNKFAQLRDTKGGQASLVNNSE